MKDRIGLFALVGVLCGCIESAPPPPRRHRTAEASPAEAQREAGSRRAAPRFVAAPAQGDADAAIRDALRDAKRDGASLVVYVGASWCEPCQSFHQALENGELDDALAGVRFVEFDADRDGERLDAAGYGGRLIPRFALPGEDGKFGGVKIEGGIKGAGAVEHIMTRLGPMLADADR